MRKKFYVNFDHGVGADGIRHKTVKTFDTISEARRALSEFETDKARGDVVSPTKTTVGDWLSYWLESVIKINREETTIYPH